MPRFHYSLFPTLVELVVMGLILLILLIVLIAGGLPRWNHSRDWGYGPSGGLGLILFIIIILILLGHIPRGF